MRPATYYRLDETIGDGKVPVPCSCAEWSEWLERAGESRVVAKTRVGFVLVSTVFIGLDHYYGADPDHPPLIFETMAFDESSDERWKSIDLWFARCSTWEEAHWNHRETVESVVASTGFIAES